MPRPHDTGGNRRPGKRRDKRYFRPNFRRQLLLAGLAFAAIFVGYAVGYYFKDKSDGGVVRSKDAMGERRGPGPWYKTQPPPPALLTGPNLPIYPDVSEHNAQIARLAYEESLPRETYAPPAPPPPSVKPVPPRVKIPKSPAGPKETPGPAVRSTPPAAQSPAVEQPAETAAALLPRWRRYAAAAPKPNGNPRIALVIDDMGLDRRHSDMVVGFPGPLTLSYITYAEDLTGQTAAARKAGHELLLHVSMEPGSKAVDPGPNVLLTSHSADELRRRLEWGLSRFPGFVGVNNHMGSKFTSDAKGMRVVLQELKKRDLMFLDSRTSRETMAGELARKLGLPVAERNIFLDHDNTVDAVNGQLVKLERLARARGVAVAIGHPRKATVRALKSWLATIESRGFQLVPLSSVARVPRPAG